MPLAVGTRLGNIEILGQLGAGGMGEVYRGRDTKLDREVAVKVLPPAYAQHPERLARFEREAKVLASLNHPNIATIYAVEESPEGKALVMELVKGQTLKGPVPVDTALKYAAQIASALDAAHEKGITHRDLKPANIMVTPDGTIKVLDFGLAAVTQPSQSDGEIGTNMATLTMSPTSAGMIMGTAAYMSPEQASGQTVDRRADIWSFGVVLWELLTGKQLFGGTTFSHILASVLKDEPDYTQVPFRVRRLLRRCLEKDPQKRLLHIGDAMELIDVDAEAAPVAAKVPPSRFGRLPWIAAGVLGAGLLIGMWAPWRETKPWDLPLIQLDLDLGPDVNIATAPGSGSRIALSPDGSRLVFMSQARLYTRRLDQSNETELKGAEGASAPFFSPDGKWVVFFAQGKLKKISVEGGAALTLCDAGGGATGGGGSWGDDGNIIFATIGPLTGELMRVPSAGGAPTPVIKRAPGEVKQGWPQFLPGSKAALFTSSASSLNGLSDANIDVVSVKDGQRKTLVHGGTYPRYIPGVNGTGYLLYANQSTLFAVPFDLDKLEVRGNPVPVAHEVATGSGGAAQLDLSRSGMLAYRRGTVEATFLQWVGAGGQAQPLGLKAGNYRELRLSPDGQRLALNISDGQDQDIWVYDLQRDTLTRLTFGGLNTNPVWSPDGRHLVFENPTGIFWTRADGAGKPQALTQSSYPQIPYSFSPDGKRLAFAEGYSLSTDLWTLPVDSDGAGLRASKPEVFLQSPSEELAPAFSPDGRWIAYQSNESGKFEIYVRPFPAGSGKWQISTGGGDNPKWARNGQELFFRSSRTTILMAKYAVRGDSFVAEKPQIWLTGDFGAYDVSPDGKRIITDSSTSSAGKPETGRHVTFLLNFFDEVRRKVPVAK